MQKHTLHIFFTTLFLMIYAFSFSQNEDNFINILPQELEEFTVAKHFVYSSKSENKNIQELISDTSLLEFTPKEFVNTGAFNHYNWIKIDLKNTSNLTNFIFEFNQTYVDSLKIFLVENNTIVKSFPTKGLHFEQNNNSSYLSNKYAYTYELNIAKNETISLYINAIVNDGSFRVINKIWSPKKYEERKKDIIYRTSYLIFFGGFTSLVVLISIAMFFFSFKKLYLYYAGFVLVISINLVALRYFINPIYIEKYLFFGNNFADMLALLQVYLMLQYFNHFFSLKEKYKKIYRLLNTLAKITITIFFLSLFFRRFDWFYAFVFYFTKLEMVLTAVLIYGIAIYLVRKKEIMAYYFVIAYAPLMVVVFHFILTAMKLTSSYNPLQWEFVIFVEIFVLSIAMTHNYYLLIQENIAYQKKIFTQRLKISRDLHDNIGAHLTFIISSIENLKYGFKFPENITNKLTTISEFTSETIHNLRDTIWAMNKNEITFEDFHSRILTFIEKAKIAKENTLFNFDNNVKSNITFTSFNGMNIFRVIQEAINNSIKYAEASEINIDINENSDSLTIFISDDGKGFDITKIDLGNGLENMQKRIDEIGAKLIINSEIRKGTSIKIIVKKYT